MRIARALALAGVDSRRKCEEYIKNGAVMVNGEVICDMTHRVNVEKDLLSFRGKTVFFEKPVGYILNKPRGYATTASDPHVSKTVYELLPKKLVSKCRNPRHSKTRVFSVGRLDKSSTGLLLFTNDGELAHRLMHPRYGVEKWYLVRLDQAFHSKDILRLRKGIPLREGLAKFERVQPVSRRIIRVLIKEGRKREIRRIFAWMGYEVLDLCRIAFGPIQLGKLPTGQGRFLSFLEMTALRKRAGLTPANKP